MIHKSHTKKDLQEVVDVFEFGEAIEDFKALSKEVLVKLLDIHLRTIMDIKPHKEYFDFDDISDLHEYLRRPSPKHILTIKEKDMIIDKSKKIIFYCQIAGCCVGSTTYGSLKEIKEDVEIIKKYGDIPTCRRALTLLKQDSAFRDICLTPMMTYRTQQRLARKKRLKEGAMARVSINHGTFLVDFA